ncbi:MAG: UDP-glucose 4-epimerase GalE [Clostridiales bacterium 43-6]|nr:MAG: UDP-glucose 4-epimerase GalE [Clostridiales bacterium 43-6]
MSILVTGGAGYIGSHTCVELLNKGEDIIVIDNFYNSKPEALKRVKEITGKDFQSYTCDILDKETLSAIFKENNITEVIHFAGLKAVGESCRLPLAYYHNNISGTVILLQVMEQFGVKKIVFSSSATVYGDSEIPYKEIYKTGNVTSPYGRTKFMIEEILKDVYRSDNDWSVALLRYFNPIGAHESGKIGEDPNGIPNNLVPYIAQVAIGKLAELPVYGNDYETPDGTGVRDYIHVTDLAVGHLKAVEFVRKSAGLEAINLGAGKGYSVLEVIAAFEKASGKKINYKFFDRRPGDIDMFYADAEKAEKLLGFRTKLSIDKMCEDTWRWQSDNPGGY